MEGGGVHLTKVSRETVAFLIDFFSVVEGVGWEREGEWLKLYSS